MVRIRYGVVAAVVAVLGFQTAAIAQQAPAAAPPPAAAAPVPAVPAPEPPASQLAAAREVVIASGMSRSFAPMIPQLMEQIGPMLTRTRPEMAKDLSDVLKQLAPEFDKKADDMLDVAAHVYARRMSEEELKQTAAFFNTPGGQEIRRQPAGFARRTRRGHAGLDAADLDLHDDPRPPGDDEEGASVLMHSASAARVLRWPADAVDLFVIGAGSGGVRAARIAAGHNAKVMIAEDDRIGGTCVLRGCVPKKLYVYASRFADDFADAAGYGWTLGERRFDWQDLVAAKEAEVSRLSSIYRRNLEQSGATIVETRARLDGPHHVVLGDGRRIEAAHILVATGSQPELHPEIPGLEFAITSNEIFDLREFPKRLLIVGRRLYRGGVRVHLLPGSARPLRWRFGATRSSRASTRTCATR